MSATAEAVTSPAEPVATAVDLRAEFERSGVKEVLAELDRDLIGLAPVKKRTKFRFSCCTIFRFLCRDLWSPSRLVVCSRPAFASDGVGNLGRPWTRSPSFEPPQASGRRVVGTSSRSAVLGAASGAITQL